MARDDIIGESEELKIAALEDKEALVKAGICILVIIMVLILNLLQDKIQKSKVSKPILIR